MANPLDVFKNQMANLQKVNQTLNVRQQALDSREKLLNDRESQLKQGIVPTTGPQSMVQNFKSALDMDMRPGNLGSINDVIWPFYFTTRLAIVQPNSAVRSGYTITQEAAFIAMSITKAVFTQTVNEGADTNIYIDPDDTSANGIAPGLAFTLRDSQSARDFQNSPINLDNIGGARWPSNLPRPILQLPNSNMEITFQNSHASNIYVPFITVFGYRIRVENAQDLLGTVFA